jgi:uncharacterized protein YeaO (DUF488 family)
MLARYQIVRGERPAGNPLPEGTRIDVRKHVHHVLSPNAESVVRLLDDPAGGFAEFAREYRALLAQRFREQRAAFDALAELARREDVYIGCNCPTRKNPDVQRCHTVLALQFMQQKYPALRVQLPA